ncbi:MAG: pyruvate formate lyase 1-activating protein [Kangiellaceae bacterium]|nr:pyruvate formate lyase 1-activating protein [Kangiellaceae bacterium]
MPNELPLTARIHSFESCGTVDGPGIRSVVFFQGCLMRCKYCHNRDTWDRSEGHETTVEELMKDVRSYKPYFNASGGGITASGGEPLLQPEFVRELFHAAKREGIHTCLDSNGFTQKAVDAIDQVLDVTDLVMLDIKHMDNDIHQNLIGVSNSRVLNFARHLQQRGQKTWIRYVVVPSYNDDEPSAHRLGEFIKGMDNVEKIEILPYHQLGEHKWKTLGYDYELKGINPPSEESLNKLKAIFEYYGLKVS